MSISSVQLKQNIIDVGRGVTKSAIEHVSTICTKPLNKGRALHGVAYVIVCQRLKRPKWTLTCSSFFSKKKHTHTISGTIKRKISCG